MASRFGPAGGIPDRRVRAIWVAVDSRQFKTAYKLAAGLLAKYPNSLYALALKALILEKMGKPDEALSVCLNAKELLYSDDVVHIDDLTLSTLQIVFQRLDRLDLAISCYEHACGKYPNNLEIMMGLFNCYVHEYSFVKQQQPSKCTKLWVKKGFCSGQFAAYNYSPDDWESFLHYLGCLLEDDMYWSKASTTDQICSFGSVDFQVCEATHLTEEVFDSRISSALSFVQELQMDIQNDYIRGPFLAIIEIERRRRLHGKADDGKFMEALLNYFHRFSHLSSFTSDVEMFLCILTETEKAKLLEKFVNIMETSSTSPVKVLGQAITIFKIQELFGIMFTLPIRELEGIAKGMVEMYCKNLILSTDLDPQENMHGEELLSVASNVLVLLFWRTKKLGYLLEATMVLEFGLNIRRDVWQYKVPLLHLYSHMGALPLAYEWFIALEVKNILLETNFHHILTDMLKSPHWLETADLLKEYLKFMDDHLREAADLTFLAYRHRNYSKVIEFVKFKERFQHSDQLLMARLEAFILQLKQKADNLEEVEGILENVNYGIQLLELSNEDNLKSLTFNGYFQARPWWSPTPDINYLSEPFEEGSACLREKSVIDVFKIFVQYRHKVGEKEWIVRKHIETKSLIPRLVYLSIRSSSSSLKENLETNVSTVVIIEMKCLLERYASNIGLPFDDAIDVILGIAKGQKSFEDFGSDIVSWINFTIFVNAWNLCSHHPGLVNEDGCSLGSWYVIKILVKSCISELLMQAQPMLTSPGSILPVLVQLVTESFAWHILIIQSCIKATVPPGKKKKKGGAVDQMNSPHLQAICDSIQCLSDAIQGIQKWVDDQIDKPEDQNLDILLSHVQLRDCEEGPGFVLQILEESASAENSELGDRISRAIQSWNSADALLLQRSHPGFFQDKLLSMSPPEIFHLTLENVRGEKGVHMRRSEPSDGLGARFVFELAVNRHGVHQNRTGWADGPEYLTQCPIMPAGSYTYRFTIENQEGTLWWHAHSSWLRATVHGALIIYPKEGSHYPFPKPNKEIPVILGEWWNRNPIDVLRQAMKTGAAPNISDAFLINGQPGDLYNCSREDTTVIPVASGETNLLRIVNAALNNELFFTIAGHKMTVVAADAAYTKPFTTSVLKMGPGETTDVLVTTNQPRGRYYIAARAFATAQGVPFDNTTTTAILEYNGNWPTTKIQAGTPPKFPVLPAFNDTATAAAYDAGIKSPHRINLPGPVDEYLFYTVGLGLFNCPPEKQCGGPNNTRFGASMNNVSFTFPRYSILEAYYQRKHGVFAANFPAIPPVQFDYTAKNISRALQQPARGTRLYPLKYGSVVQLVMQGTNIFAGEEHPMHIHGYQFYVLAAGFGNFDPRRDTARFNLVDPPLRNTVGVPVNGWAVIRFVANNPGVWLVHCHLDVHLTWGLATAFLVENGVGELQSLEPPPADLPKC
ncbi:Laccase [Cocos nucifera]|uniref:Laccase n=1 Tax=Cocos nucifera TaxID=13894 RepID=A0A8K0I6V8_COCNU|nr:Laccase [Cocos nucifera]